MASLRHDFYENGLADYALSRRARRPTAAEIAAATEAELAQAGARILDTDDVTF